MGCIGNGKIFIGQWVIGGFMGQLSEGFLVAVFAWCKGMNALDFNPGHQSRVDLWLSDLSWIIDWEEYFLGPLYGRIYWAQLPAYRAMGELLDDIWHVLVHCVAFLRVCVWGVASFLGVFILSLVLRSSEPLWLYDLCRIIIIIIIGFNIIN